MKKSGYLFWLRLVAVLIDLAIIYCIAILLETLIRQFIFMDFINLFVSTFLFYYFFSYWLLKGRTPAKLLTGIKVVKLSEEELPVKNIIVRELLAKGIIGLIIPVYLFENVFQIWSYLLTAAVVIIGLLLSWIFFLIFKNPWWEKISATKTMKENVSYKTSLKISFISIVLIIAASLFLIIHPFYKNLHQLRYFTTSYPATAEVKKYADFVKRNSQDPVEYVFDLFSKYDIVVLSERVHSEYTQYDLISKIVKDDRFFKQVGNIFTEQGSVSFQDTVNTYLHTLYANEDELNKSTALLQRNSNGVQELWDYTNLFDFLKMVNKLNCTIEDSSKINWYFTDLPVNWETTTAENHLKGYTPQIRDSIMADHVIQKYNDVILKQKRKKALVIMNSQHGYGLINIKSGISSNWMNKNIPVYSYVNNKGTTTSLMKNFPGKVANVLINTVSQKYGPVLMPVQNGKWDAAFSVAGNTDVGFNFAGSPFGEDKFDLFYFIPKSITYKDVFTGFIFYKPLKSHIKKNGFPHEFDNFEDTLLRRASCVGASNVKRWKRQINFIKTNQQRDPINSEIFPYALLYNVVNVLVISVILILVLLISCIFFVRQFKRKY